MPKTIRIATVQMNAMPAPTEERLARAEGIIAQCAQAGAQLVVLPEVFNTGYEYSDKNYLRAESFDGPTISWMRKTAAHYGIHLAGTLLRTPSRSGVPAGEQGKIYNTMLLAAPDGQQWHYNKNYPWMFERAYFEKGTDITIADTGLGKIGFLICWDVAHTDLWQRYAGKVELMVVSSCPPKAADLTVVFPDGKRVMGESTPRGLLQDLKRAADETFGAYLRRQAAFLGVPVAHATSTGIFTSPLPSPRISLAMLSLIYPPLWKYASRFDETRMEADYYNETYIADHSGTVLERVQQQVEGYVVSNVSLSDFPPQPIGKQPAFGLAKFAYVFDKITNKLLASEYQKKTRKYLGH